MKINYTDSQKEAIELRDKNIIVSAAAGSGKTRVLVDRIIKLIIEDKKDISSMIIVTFTNKASIEMKTRIKDELNNILKSDYLDKKFIVEQIGKLKNAHIQTMHAFCADMIRENFYYFKNLSPKFTIITQNQESVLKKDSIDQLFEREYESMDVEFKLFLDNFSNLRDDLPARKAILKTYNLVQSQLYPIEWLKNKTEKKIDLYVFKEIIKEKLENLKESIEDLLSRMQGKKGIHKFKVRVKFFEFVNDDLIKISKLYSLVDENWDDFVSKISSLKFDGRIAKSKEDDEFDLNIIKEVRNEYKEQLKTLQLDLINKSSAILNRNNYLESRILCKLSELTSDFNKIYSLKKMEQNCLDFNDLEHFFIKLLDNEQVLKELVEKFEYIYFDEYQDSNLIQNHIINKLKRNNNLFLVGDLKQSIYRFRLAKPDLFIQKLKEYEKDSQSRRINLNENFRTEKNLIEFNNYIFDRLMTLENSSIDYKNGGHRLNWTVDNSKKYNDIASVELDLIQDDGYEYDFISKRIIELKSKGAQYRDIAILLRSSTNLYKLRNSLEKYEIPYYSDMDSSSFKNVEINFFISLLKLIVNINDDINLLAVIQSEIFGFNENEIAMIKLYSQKNSFYDNLISYDKEDKLSNKINDFLTKIQDYNYKLQTYDVFKFAYYVFENSGYYKFLCCRDRAFERIKNVENIIGLLCEYDKKYDNGLIGFLDYVNELKVNKSDLFNSPRELSEDEDVVRIMTIHKSKGLEFPIVILADMNKQFSTQDSRENLLFDEDLGIGINLKDISTNSQFTSLRKSLIYEKLSIENKKEEMRVLYVALTRAKNNLILIGSKKRDKLLIRKSYLEINNTLDWVLKALNTDKIMSEYTDSDYNTDIFDDTKLKINIIESENLKQNHDFEEVKFIEDEYQDKRLVDFMDKTFNFIYPFEEETNKAFKFSVTEISKSFDQSDSGYVNDMNTYELDFTKPDFMLDQTRISPQQRGTIIHTIFQNLSLKKHSRNSIIEEINEMVKDDKLLLEEIKLVDYDKILKFFDHKITKSLINKSDKIVREESFLMKLEDNYINGQIDFYAIIENTIIIVDIKTDFQMRSSIYKKQLEYYQMAVEKALGMKVIKKYLYWYNYNKYEEV